MAKRMAFLLMGLISGALHAQTNVAVSIGQPGFYGQIVLGDAYPAPQVVYPQPVIVRPPPVAVIQSPLYLRVPPGHMKRWRNYCGRYQACGREVYFVQNNWYQNEYAPRYNAAYGHSHLHGDLGWSHPHGNFRHDHDRHDHDRHGGHRHGHD